MGKQKLKKKRKAREAKALANPPNNKMVSSPEKAK